MHLFNTKNHETALESSFDLKGKYIALVNELMPFVTRNLALNFAGSVAIGFGRHEMNVQDVRGNTTLAAAITCRHWAEYKWRNISYFTEEEWEKIKKDYEDQIKNLQADKIKTVLNEIEPQLNKITKIILQYLEFKEKIAATKELGIDISETVTEGFKIPTPKVEENKFAKELSLLNSNFDEQRKVDAERRGAEEINLSRSLMLSPSAIGTCAVSSVVDVSIVQANIVEASVVNVSDDESEFNVSNKISCKNQNLI